MDSSLFQRHWGIRAERGDFADDEEEDSVIIHVPASDDEKNEVANKVIEEDPLEPFMVVYKRMLLGLAGLCVVYVFTHM